MVFVAVMRRILLLLFVVDADLLHCLQYRVTFTATAHSFIYIVYDVVGDVSRCCISLTKFCCYVTFTFIASLVHVPAHLGTDICTFVDAVQSGGNLRCIDGTVAAHSHSFCRCRRCIDSGTAWVHSVPQTAVPLMVR